MTNVPSRSQLKIFSWTGAGILAGILLLANYVVSYVPLRLDFSDGRIYSLASGTKQVLKTLDDTMLVRVIFSDDLPPQFKLNEEYVRDLLLEYKRASHGKIRIEFLDPSKSAAGRQVAQESGVGPVQLDVIQRDRREVKECFMGLAIFYGDKKDAIPLIRETNGLEYEITQRIKKLIKPGELRIGFVSTGGALTPSSKVLEGVQGALQQQFSVDTVDLKTGEIPAYLKSLWLVGPEKDMDDNVTAKLQNWVAGGGTLGLVLDRRKVNLEYFSSEDMKSGLDSLLQGWGIDFKEGLIVDPRCDRIQLRTQQGYFQMINIVDYPYFPMVVDMNRDNPATKGIDGVTMPFVSALVKVKDIPGLKVTSLLKTSPESWLDTSPSMMNPLQRKSKPAQALEGPFDVGLLMEGNFGLGTSTAPAKPGRVILLSSSKFIRSDFGAKQANLTLFLNLLDWSAQDEALLSIRAKGAAVRPLKDLPEAGRLIVKYMLIIFLPILSLIVGLIVWKREKTRRALLPLAYID